MTTNDRLTHLRNRALTLLEQRHLIDTELEEIKAAVRDLLDGPDRYAAGDGEIVISTNRRFNERRALELLPEALVPLVTYPDTRVDKDKLRALAPDVFDQAQDVYTERVTFQ